MLIGIVKGMKMIMKVNVGDYLLVHGVDEISSNEIIEEIKPVLQNIDNMVEKLMNDCKVEINEIEVFGSVSNCSIYKEHLKKLLETKKFISFFN